MQWTNKHHNLAAICSGTDDKIHSNFIVRLENLLKQKEKTKQEVEVRAAETSKTSQ